MSISSDDTSVLGEFQYPRTGKRGVPQQFPRKLYDMLEIESEGQSESTCCVHWAASGSGFKIANVAKFSEVVLPKYFKTSKFSSFQRNLNLYGFVKNRRGPEVDVYSNAKFNRGDLDMLSHLTKRKPTESKKMQEQKSLSSPQNNVSSSSSLPSYVRTVSPTISFVGQEKFIHVTDTSSTPINTRGLTHSSLNIQPNSPPLSYQKIGASVSMPSHVHNSAHLVSPSNKPCQGGRLDLLAEAMRTVIANERSSFEREFA
ncbi:predicted protein [Thalassiosira pseudonana CCMP1335]|uniref:HSF-type DNA-binding domain-containing protein n=1 Tax=Thalassiosira pseudonana TaxID=35128 RepID=B8BYI5_THAPS|nr:predicted protein [Thalassiosira pseudonana CCMP1335]EED94380.1 predicted protein [Thalassiosira pseudonana CCMP1335]